MDTYRDDREDLRVAALNKWATDLDQKLEALNAEVRNSQTCTMLLVITVLHLMSSLGGLLAYLMNQ